MFDSKVCSECQKELSFSCFKTRTRPSGFVYYYPYCYDCLSKKNKNYKLLNKDKISKYEKLRYKKQSIKINNQAHLYYHNNKNRIINRIKQYIKNNKEHLNKINQIRKKNRRKIDAFYRLKLSVSGSVYLALKKQHSSKNKISCFKYLPYTISQLKQHLENKFEDWMSWDNWGVYNAKLWDDNDKSTWTWQIDHIIPQSKLPYVLMTESNFIKCWSLNNLRPYSAKQNIIEKDRR